MNNVLIVQFTGNNREVSQTCGNVWYKNKNVSISKGKLKFRDKYKDNGILYKVIARSSQAEYKKLYQHAR